MHWAVYVSAINSEIDSELNILMPILMKDPNYLSLNMLEQYKMFHKLYTFILDKKGLSAPKIRKHNYLLARTRF